MWETKFAAQHPRADHVDHLGDAGLHVIGDGQISTRFDRIIGIAHRYPKPIASNILKSL